MCQKVSVFEANLTSLETEQPGPSISIYLKVKLQLIQISYACQSDFMRLIFMGFVFICTQLLNELSEKVPVAQVSKEIQLTFNPRFFQRFVTKLNKTFADCYLVKKLTYSLQVSIVSISLNLQETVSGTPFEKIKLAQFFSLLITTIF